MHVENSSKGEGDWAKEARQLDSAYRRGEESRKFWADMERTARRNEEIIFEGKKYEEKGYNLLESKNPKVLGLAKYYFKKAKFTYEKFLEVSGLHGEYEPLQRCNDILKSLESKCAHA